MLPYDPFLRVRWRGRRLLVRLSTLLVIGFACVGATVADGRGGAAWLGGLTVLALLLAVLLLHLGARAWIGGRLGQPVRRAHVAVFGAVPDPLDDADSPRGEVLVGVAGLVVLATLALAQVAVARLLNERPASIAGPTRIAAIALAGFALVQAMPALPLDGGRIFRGLVWYLTDSPVAGARAAAIYAQVIAIGLIVCGLIAFTLEAAYPYLGLWAVIGGWQIGAEARSRLFHLRWQRLARITPLEDLLFPALSLSAETIIEEAIDTLLGAGAETPFLVRDTAGDAVGVVRLPNLRGCPRREWSSRTIGEIATPLTGLARLDAARPVNEALTLLDALEGAPGQPPGGAVLLVERDGAPVAVLDRRALLVRLLTHERHQEPVTPATAPGRKA